MNKSQPAGGLKKKVLRRLGQTAFAIMLSSIAVSTGYANAYLDHSRQPNGDRVLPLITKDTTVYASATEIQVLNLMRWMTYVSGAVLILVIAFYGQDAFKGKS